MDQNQNLRDNSYYVEKNPKIEIIRTYIFLADHFMGMRYLGMLGLELVWADHMQHTTHLALVPCTLGFHLNISPKIFKHLLL